MAKSYLNRIIAIDNISRGEFVDIPASEHTNFNGVIRAGKTTTLRAALLFYGTRPSDIAKAKGDAFEGFASFYFPNLSSFLVYEYNKDNNLYCVVCSKYQNQVQYQFLDTAYQQDYFLHQVESKTMLANQSQFKIAVEAKGHELTPRMGADVYAKIIQSNKPYREKGNNADLIRKLRPKYALPAHGYAIDNIDRVLANIFASKASVANIRSALTNILVHESAIDSPELKLDENTSHISDWFDKREAWLDVDNRRDNVKVLLEHAHSFKECIAQLSGLYARAEELKDENKHSIAALEISLADDGNKHSDYSIQLIAHRESSSKISLDLENELRKLRNQIDELEVIKKNFVEGRSNGKKTDKPIAELISLHNGLSTKEKAERDAKKFFEEISSGQQDILSKYEKLRTSIDQSKLSYESDANKLELEQLNSRSASVEQLQHNFEQKRLAAEQLWSKREEKASALTTQLSGSKVNKQAQLDNISPLPEFVESIASLEKEAEQSRQDELSARDELEKYTHELNAQQLVRTKIEADRSSCTLKETSLKQDRDDLSARVGDDTLFDFLSANVEGFENNIGKVLSPELLALKNLDPQYTSNCTGVYGLELNLDAIAERTLNTKDSIYTRVIALDEEIASQEKMKESLNDKLQASNEMIATLKKDEARAKFNKQTAESHSRNIRDSLLQEKEKSAAEMEARKEDLENQLLTLQTDLNNALLKKVAVEKEKRNALLDIENEYKEQKKSLNVQHDLSIEAIANDLAMKIKKQDEKIAELNAQENKDIEAGGFSPDTLTKAKASLALSEKEYTTARNAGERVGRYENFIETRWSTHAGLVSKAQLVSSELEAHQDETASVQLNFTNQIEALEATMGINREKLVSLRKISTFIDELGEKFTGLEVKPNSTHLELYRTTDAAEAKLKMSKLVGQREDIKKRGQTEFNIIKLTFQRKLGTPTFVYFERLLTEQSTLHPTGDLWWACAIPLDEYLDGDHLSQSDLLRSDYQLVAQSITEFSEKISSTHKELNLLGRRLTSSMKGVAKHFEAIGDLDLSISSNLRSLDYFSALEDFRHTHEDWRINHYTDLPGDKLISKLSSLVAMLGSKTLVIDVARSFKFEVSLIEDGNPKTARTDDEIESISSNGTSYIIILSLYIGLINMIRKPESGVQLQFCIDELGRVDTESSGKLIEILDSQQIKMFSALPIQSADLLQHYPYCYMITSTPSNQRKYNLYSDISKTPTSNLLTKALEES